MASIQIDQIPADSAFGDGPPRQAAEVDWDVLSDADTETGEYEFGDTAPPPPRPSQPHWVLGFQRLGHVSGMFAKKKEDSGVEKSSEDSPVEQGAVRGVPPVSVVPPADSVPPAGRVPAAGGPVPPEEAEPTEATPAGATMEPGPAVRGGPISILRQRGPAGRLPGNPCTTDGADVPPEETLPVPELARQVQDSTKRDVAARLDRMRQSSRTKRLLIVAKGMLPLKADRGDVSTALRMADPAIFPRPHTEFAGKSAGGRSPYREGLQSARPKASSAGPSTRLRRQLLVGTEA